MEKELKVECGEHPGFINLQVYNSILELFEHSPLNVNQ